jgi:hypothetical protein
VKQKRLFSVYNYKNYKGTVPIEHSYNGSKTGVLFTNYIQAFSKGCGKNFENLPFKQNEKFLIGEK